MMIELGRVKLAGGDCELVVGYRRDLPLWEMPAATEQQYMNHISNWQILNGEGLIKL